jgi:hypothetical protein
MHLTDLDLLFWTAGFGAHLILFYVLLIRRRYREFPIFSTFIFSNIVRTVALYFVERHGSKASYFYSFWSLGLLDTALQLAVVYEMYFRTFRPLGQWARDIRGALSWLLVAIVAVAAGLTWLAAPPVRLWMQAVVIRSNFFSSVCLSELFVGMIVLSVKSGLPWKSHVARISQGLGVYSGIDLLIETGHSYFGVGRNTQVYAVLSHFRMSAYLVCVAYWIIMLWRNAPEPRKLPDGLRGKLIRLQHLVDSDLDKIRVRK